MGRHTEKGSAGAVSRRHTLAMLSSTAILAGCGGGDGGGGTPAPTPSPLPTPTPTPTATAGPVVGPAWYGYGRDAQHTALSAIASQNLGKVAWQTPVDVAPQYTASGGLLTHYGSPVVTIRDTVIIPVKTGATGGFRVEAHKGSDGSLVWQAATDYALPPSNWTPPMNILLTAQGRFYYPAAGGRIMARQDADLPGLIALPQTFYGASAYDAAPATYNATVFVNTPLTADAAGNLFFGFQVTGANPANLVSGIARIGIDGSMKWVGAAAAAGDPTILKPATNCAPAISNDGGTVYIAVNRGGSAATNQTGMLLALDATTLVTKAKVELIDPGTGGQARLNDNGTSSPVVGPDGRVFYGVLEGVFGTHNARGWLLQFDSLLNSAGAPGSFGWDVSPTIIPIAMVPSYTGPSTYLLALKYNNYFQAGTGDGLNRLAVLDPRTSQADPVTPSVQCMREVMTILGPTNDYYTPNSRKEWCINTMAADPARKSVLANNEDGILYRWDLTTNTLTQSVKLTNGLGQAYTPTLVGPEGTVYAINNAILFAVRA
ncbi:hypothetical protein [Tsuneonella sp. HG222]